MANVQLSNADNVRCFYAGHSMSLFMNLSRPAAVVAMCADSTVDDVPILLNLILQRVDDAVVSLPTLSRSLIVRPQRERGAGADIVSFTVENGDLLKVSMDLGLCSERSRQLSATHPPLMEHVLVDQLWVINETFTLLFRLRSTPQATWPVLANPQWNEVPRLSPSALPDSPRSSSPRQGISEGGYLLAEDSVARQLSTVRSMTGHTTRPFSPSEPRSLLQRGLFLDQVLFPILRIFFVPELFAKAISTPPLMVWNMSLQVTVERSASRKPRRAAAHKRVSGRERRWQGQTLNLTVEESVVVSGASGEEEAKTPCQFEAIVLSFNADYRYRSGSGGNDGGSDACDVARANRLVVDDFTFNVLVSANNQADVKVEEITRTVYSYCTEHEEMADVLDLDLDDLMEYIYDRYAYMKTTPYFDSLPFLDTVWQAVRLYLINGVTEGESYDVDMYDGALLMDGVLASA
ncbi:hypothetical protein ABL78_5539 [Leptomonas seymouri]|uniref:Uncharacterized protein n=1 Tax=Leptomonas seymouri TaxID=5684 RepID=A0A0N1I4P0_LEPSE|nr:hypothetical protein ABL78_5539 [Leptomonas seymouri]|eukprot:KPI85414.1 hypothetical protein ABL78_5539 [Leptomonas seymouri]